MDELFKPYNVLLNILRIQIVSWNAMVIKEMVGTYFAAI